jgi:imidazoleglycerol-phosphate dehydratase
MVSGRFEKERNMNERKSTLQRETAETNISVSIALDGTGQASIQTGIGFFDHLLTALAKHSGMDLSITAKGDLHIDGHHTVEDTGIVLGKALHVALGDRKSITRFGHAYCPLDEALARAVIDISGRGFLAWECPVALQRVGEFDGELLEEFLRALAVNAGITLHVSILAGKNNHHIMESAVKALARSWRMAASIDPRQNSIPSTKGTLA